MNLLHSAATHVGHIRKNNEDAFLGRPPLYAVSDGMGGHSYGEVASAIAIETLSKYPFRSPPEFSPAFHLANLTILADAKKSGRTGMGTTLTAMILADGCVHFGHAGDSALFLVRKNKAYRLTEIQSDSHILSNCLGFRSEAFHGAQVGVLPVEPGDVLVLCTDGLTNYDLEGKEIARLATYSHIEDTASHLVEFALKKGGEDNVTVVAVKVLT